MTNDSPIETDYLVVGTGATAMAFVDTLLDESPAATVTMVDRQHRPGGHWNVAYPFVRVHQPAEWYGVPSIELGSGRCDAQGPNAGLYGLASGAEVLAHFDRAMRERFLPSGRVRWLPCSEFTAGERGSGGVHRVTSRLHGGTTAVRVKRRLVDATLARTEVPATHPPKYRVADGVACIPPNALPQLARPHAAYCVVGSGKTGIDSVLWLLEQGVPASRIRWVVPRDAWWFDRANIQPGLENFERNMAYPAAQFDAIAHATSLHDLFARLEHSGALLRLDPAVTPTTFRCAVVSRGELALLRSVGEIVRRGRVLAIERDRLVCTQGEVPADPDTLYVNCSASAIQHPALQPVFDGDTIRLLMVRTCQPTFSGALIAWVESHVDGDTARNALCAPVPSPERPIDWLRMWDVTLRNTVAWRQVPALHDWLMRCRLNGQAVMLRGVAPDDTARMNLFRANGAKAAAAMAKLPALLAEVA